MRLHEKAYKNSDESDEERLFRLRREEMVSEQLMRKGIHDPEVLQAMSRVKRHLFVPDELKAEAYEDGPLPIGNGQTISQPFIVAYMTQVLGLGKNDRVLEIGTGCGYQTAVLAEIVKKVYSIEIVSELAERAAERLRDLGYSNIKTRKGNGYKGWPEEQPFDAILVTAAPEEVPQALLDQLKPGGKMVVPVGSREQELRLIQKTDEGLQESRLMLVRFVPMVNKSRSAE